MRIVDIRDAVFPISSPIRNAYLDFSKMTASVVAVVTDVVRDGKPVVGYGFNSNGRYAASGLLNERFLPRLKEADPASLLNQAGDNLDPRKIWATMMANEKPGGHGERSVAVGVVDMAVWDAVAKLAGVPLYRYLADTEGDGTVDESVFVYAAGGYSGHGLAIATLAGKLVAEAVQGTAERFDVFASLPQPRFPGGARLRWPLLVLAMTWYALRDRL